MTLRTYLSVVVFVALFAIFAGYWANAASFKGSFKITRTKVSESKEIFINGMLSDGKENTLSLSICGTDVAVTGPTKLTKAEEDELVKIVENEIKELCK